MPPQVKAQKRRIRRARQNAQRGQPQRTGRAAHTPRSGKKKKSAGALRGHAQQIERERVKARPAARAGERSAAGRETKRKQTNKQQRNQAIYICMFGYTSKKRDRPALESVFSKLDGSEEEQRIGNALSVSRETAEADEETRKRKRGKRRERQNMLFCARAVYGAQADPCCQPHGVSAAGICRPSERGSACGLIQSYNHFRAFAGN